MTSQEQRDKLIAEMRELRRRCETLGWPLAGMFIQNALVELENTTPSPPRKTDALRQTLIEHLDAAQGILDDLGDEPAGYLLDRLLDEVRSTTWPETDPNLELFRRPPKATR